MQSAQTFSVANLIGTFAGFILGLASALVIEAVKRRQEKQRLINLFLAELFRTRLETAARANVPTDPSQARSRTGFLSVSAGEFHGGPEYEVSVYTERLYETEGIRLAQLLKANGRHSFWMAYGYLRDAEAVRMVIQRLPEDHKDHQAYRELFVALIKKADRALGDLEKSLQEERSQIDTIKEALGRKS